MIPTDFIFLFIIRVFFFLWSELIRVQFYFILIFLFDPSWSESIRVDPTRTGGPSWSGPTFVPAWRKAIIRKTYCLMEYILSTFSKVSAKKTYGFILKLWQKRGQSLDESLRRGKLVKNFKIFWMNNKTIIEFSFRVLWRIMQISVDVTLLRSALFFTSYTASFNNCSIYYDKVCRDYWFLILCQIQSNCWIWPLWWSVE